MTATHICRIEIDNFRNLRDVRHDLPKSVVVVGENRSGKSNLLHALRLVLDPDLPDSARYLRAEDFWDGLPNPFAGSEIRVALFLTGFDGDEEAEAVLADCVCDADPATAKLTYIYRPRKASLKAKGQAATRADDYEFLIFGGDNDKGGSVGRDIQRWISVMVLPAMRDAERHLGNPRRTLLRPLLDRARPTVDDAVMTEVGKKLGEASDDLLAQQPLQDLQARINAQLGELAGKHRPVGAHLAFADSDPEQLLRSLRLYLKDGEVRSVSDVSLGTANLLFLSLQLQDLDDRRTAGESAGLVLAIEEPEAHLHPHLQRTLFRYALRRDDPVWVTTHSPHIASVAPLESILVLRDSATNKTPASQLCSVGELGLSKLQKRDLERYLDVTRAELVFSRGVILVEGIAEQHLIPAFARLVLDDAGLATSLDEIGVTVCNVAGVDFAPYWRVTSIDGWNIPRVVVTDGDRRKRKTGTEVWDGLVRGARLLEDEELLEQALSDTNTGDVDESLAEQGIFVNDSTLEIELAGTMPSEMKAAYASLVESKTKRKRFNEAVDAENEDVPKRISADIGKGRFAQRLAGSVSSIDHVPAIYRSAITHLLDLLTNA